MPRSSVARELRILAALSALVWACGEAATGDPPLEPSDIDPNCVSGEIEHGFCLPELPRGTPPDACPSGRFEQGVCLPALPRLQDWTCPEGWEPTPALPPGAGQISEEDGDYRVADFTYCQPPEPATDCPVGFMPVVGRSWCERAGVECPPDGALWHDEAVIRERAGDYPGRIWYVAAGASDGDGTRERPLGSISEALALAQDGDVVAAGVGVYSALATVQRPIALVGACGERTRIHGPPPASPVTVVGINVDEGAAHVTDLTISGPHPGLLAYQCQAEVRITAVTIESTAGVGLSLFESARVELESIVVRDTAHASERSHGVGVRVLDASVRIRRAAVTGNRLTGISVSGEASRLELVDVLVSDTRPAIEGSAGIGILAWGGPELDLRRTLVLRNHFAGVGLRDNTSLRGSDLRITDTERAPDDSGGDGLWVGEGATADVERAAILRNRGVGVLALSPGTELTLHQVIVADTTDVGLQIESGPIVRAAELVALSNAWWGVQVIGDDTRLELDDGLIAATRGMEEPVQDIRAGDGGIGLNVAFGATATIRRLASLGNTTEGLQVASAGTDAELEDVIVSSTGPRTSDDRWGNGLVSWGALNLRGARILLRGNHGAAVVLAEGVTADLQDLVITNTRPDAARATGGRGLYVREATASVERAAVVGSHEIGIVAMNPGTELSLTDVSVVETLPQVSDDDFGRGLVAQNGAHVDVLRGAILGNRDVGIHAVDAELVLREVRIEDTLPALSNGHGLAIDGSTLDAQRFLVRASQAAGLLVGPASTVRAEAGLITRNLVGLSVQDDTFDVATSLVDVRSIDNELDRDLSEIPLPQAADLREVFERFE